MNQVLGFMLVEVKQNYCAFSYSLLFLIKKKNCSTQKLKF